MTQIELDTLRLASSFFRQATKTLTHIDSTLDAVDRVLASKSTD